MTQIPQRQIGLQIQLAQNTQTGQPSTFAGLGSSGGGLGALSGGLSGLATSSIGGLIQGAGNTINILGLRCSVHIRDFGTANTSASVRVWGLPQSIMSQLTSLGIQSNLVKLNNMTITAGDSLSGMSTIYNGLIMFAAANYDNMPDVPFVLEGMASSVLVAKPTSFPQPFSVSEAMNTLAGKIGMTFNNVGNINIQLPPMYLAGSAMTQIQKLARAAAINIGINPTGPALEIIQKNTARAGGQAVTISKATGMIASPTFDSSGCYVKTLFNPNIRLWTSLNIQSSVLSSIAAANPASAFSPVASQFYAQKIDLDLEAQVPKGQWMMTIFALQQGQAPQISPASR